MVQMVPLTEARRQCEVLRGLVGGLDPEAVPLPEVAGLWSAFGGIARLADAAQLLLARRVKESPVWQQAGCRSAAEWMARASGGSVRRARDTLCASKRLASLPATAGALRRGELSQPQAELVAGAATADPGKEGDLLVAAGRLSLVELAEECGRVRAAADPDPEATYRRIHANRRLRTRTNAEGAWCLDARGTPDDGALFDYAIGLLTDEIFDQARAEGRREHHDAYRYDALKELLLRYLDLDDEAASDDQDEPKSKPDDTETDASDDRVATTGDREESTGEAAHEHNKTRADETKGGRHTEADATSADTNSSGEADDNEQAGMDSADGDAVVGREVPDRSTDDPADGADDSAPPADDATDERVSPGGESGPGHHAADETGSTGFPGAASRSAGPRAREAAATALGSDGKPPSPARPPNRKTRRAKRPKRSRGNPRYLALLRIDLEALTRGTTQGDELCEISGIGPVPVSVARGLLGNAIVKLVITKGVDVASVTHLGRQATAAQRVALLWTSPSCSNQACPHRLTQIDHRTDWAHTHTTTLGELDPLCPFCHGLKTYHGWALVEGTGKRALVAPSDPRHPKHRKEKSRAA